MEVLSRNAANMSDLEKKGFIFNAIQKADSKKLERYVEIVEFIEDEEEVEDVTDVETSDYRLTPEQEAELMLAVAECDDPKNLVSHKKAVTQIESWLNRSIKPEEDTQISDNHLTPKQEAELKQAIAQTHDPAMQIDHEEVMKKYKKWLH
jgi:predicted DNA binding protein